MTIQHERTSSHRTEFTNGVATMGPFADGMFRLTFFRDAIAPLSEELDVADGEQQAALTGRITNAAKAKLIREDVFTLIVSPDTLQKMGADMERAAAMALKATHAGLTS